MHRLLLLMLFLVLQAAVNAAEKVDYVNLGAVLLKDGYNQRAARVLDKVNVENKGFDFARYYSLKGILYQRLLIPELSNIFFRAALDQGNKNKSVFLYMARNYWQLHDYQGVIRAIDAAGQEAEKNRQMYVIKAEAYKKLGKISLAWQALDEGIKRYPGFYRLYRQKFYYLLELGFYRQALYYADKYIAAHQYSSKDYLSVALALRASRQYPAALKLLEEAIIRNPDNKKLIELIGQIYIDQGQYLAAALVFDWASINMPQFAEKAAILSLKSGQVVRSLQLNRRILQQKAKFRQRIGIDIYLQDYESLVTKLPALKRYSLLEDQSILYAVGYAFFHNGEYDKARHYLQQIKDNRLFVKASQIFQKIEKCENAPLECY